MPELAPCLDPAACPFTYTQWECFLALYHRVPCFIYRAGEMSEREAGWVADPAAVAAQDEHFDRLRSLGQDRRIEDFADARDVALRFLNSYLSDGGQAPAHAAAAISWPAHAPADHYPLADRETEFAEFCALLRDDSARRILGIHGPSDRGKSALLAEFFQFTQRQSGILSAYAEFKGCLLLSEVLQDLRRDLKAVRFPRFDRYRDAGPAEMLRHAFLLDLEECSHPVVLILDAFEQASDEASEWVLSRLLPLCDAFAGIRVVLGGKTLPDLQANRRLAARVRYFELSPIRDPTSWCAYGRRVLGLTSENLPDDHFVTLVNAAQGSPRAVNSLLVNLKTPAGPT
ncbi:MAG TPA: ATP-binding protein [Verrucomicrobiota bacterium]|nr:ATP-binding protein [Verrucomicrobiota bacterium]